MAMHASSWRIKLEPFLHISLEDNLKCAVHCKNNIRSSR